MRRLVALLALLWAAANAVLAGFMVVSAFTATTAAKEGPLAQASLLLGGGLIACFAILLGWQCLRLFAGPDGSSAA